MKQQRYRIYGIGVDICNVTRMFDKLESNGDKFAKDTYSGEYVKYSAIKLKHQKAQYLAKCWAVKEAFVKALGTGFTKDYSWSTIEYFSQLGHTGPHILK